MKGLRFWRVVTLIFIVAKLWGKVDMSWWQVYTPYLIDFVIMMVDKFPKAYAKRKRKGEI